jgi:hypothetical protein
VSDLLSKRWKNVVGFAWWNERWQNDTNPSWDLKIDTDMRVQDSPDLKAVFANRFKQYDSILQTTKRSGPIV